MDLFMHVMIILQIGCCNNANDQLTFFSRKVTKPNHWFYKVNTLQMESVLGFQVFHDLCFLINSGVITGIEVMCEILSTLHIDLFLKEWCGNRVFRIFHKSNRSDISASVVDIYLCVNIMLS